MRDIEIDAQNFAEYGKEVCITNAINNVAEALYSLKEDCPIDLSIGKPLSDMATAISDAFCGEIEVRINE